MKLNRSRRTQVAIGTWAKRRGADLAPFGMAAILWALVASGCATEPLRDREPSSGLELGMRACSANSHPSLIDRAAQIVALRDSIERALVRTSPNRTFSGRAGQGRVFNGNYDWHSAVHAHWALLSMARLTHDESLARRILARLTVEALRLEAQRLSVPTAEVDREMPYGNVWLLVLLHELAQHPARLGSVAEQPEIVAIRLAIENRVLQYLETTPFPEGNPGGFFRQGDPNYFNRAHTSWLFALFMLKLSQPSPAAQLRMVALEEHLETKRVAVMAQTVNGPDDFLYLPAVLWLVDHVAPAREPDVPYPGLASAFPRGRVSDDNAHQAGAVMVSVWPHAMQSAKGNREACEQLNSTIDRMLSTPQYWRFDPGRISTFETVGHFVPQFVWMAMLLEQQ